MKREIKLSNNDMKIIPHRDKADYISLNRMDPSSFGSNLISSWLCAHNTLHFLGTWEQSHNPNFNLLKFENILKKSKKNEYLITPKNWIKNTNAIGLIQENGLNESTFAHQDIALHFAYFISPTFQLYLIKEFQRLKKEAAQEGDYQLKWDVRRELSKINYHIHADAVRKFMPPKLDNLSQRNLLATEADLLNIALFGYTAKEWRVNNQGEKGNIRDHASLEQLTVLANLENLNAYLIESGFEQDERIELLNKEAIKQMELLLRFDSTKGLQNLEDEDRLMLEE